MKPKIDREYILSNTDLVSLVSETVDLRRDGSRYKGLCPFHDERTPSFTVYPDTNTFKCYGCGAQGDAIEYIMRRDRLTFKQAISKLATPLGIDGHNHVATANRPQRKPQPPRQPPSFHPWAHVERYASYDSTFVQHVLCPLLTREQIEQVGTLYALGSINRKVIFWQIDGEGRVHAGHVMQYREDGHRDKKYISWMHSKLQLPDFHLQQCLFGEHLLKAFPDKKVGLVEAEKTAVIMAALYPDYVWLSTCGKDNLKAVRLQYLRPLAGRDVVVFPDANAYDLWRTQAKAITFCKSLTISSWRSKSDLSDEDIEKGIDIADIYIRTKEDTGPMQPDTETVTAVTAYSPAHKLQRIISRHPALADMVSRLDLEAVETAEPF